MRDFFEDLELTILSSLAVKSKYSKGKVYSESPCPFRTCFQRDRDRVVHSKSFRRLKHKTQVFIGTEDHYRSRLTHTLEVAQICRHISRLLRLNEDLAEVIAFAHDLGHTPYGHSGEKELDALMSEQGGFEHNRQSRRIVDTLEEKYPDFPGLNLSFEVREGLIKHSSPWDHPEPTPKVFISLESQIVNVSDEIAYNAHDLEDGLHSKMFEEGDLEKNVPLWGELKTKIKNRYTHIDFDILLNLIRSEFISTQISDILLSSHQKINETAITSLEGLQETETPLITFSPTMAEHNKILREYLFQNFYSHPSIYRMNKKGQHIIRGLFKAFSEDTQLLPIRFQKKISSLSKERVVCDYIAGMTDTYALKEYQSIYA